MDSLTHIVLGAAIGEIILGKSIGRKAAVIGALAKTIPDFDLFYTGLNDPFAYLCYHRGHTHSLFWELLYAFPLAYIFHILFICIAFIFTIRAPCLLFLVISPLTYIWYSFYFRGEIKDNI